MKKKEIQYTIRQVPIRLDRALRKQSRQSDQSMNQAAIEAMKKGLGLQNEKIKYHDLDSLAGTWEADKEFDKAIQQQDQVDEGLWQ